MSRALRQLWTRIRWYPWRDEHEWIIWLDRDWEPYPEEYRDMLARIRCWRERRGMPL